MSEQPLSYASFVNLVVEALEAADITYLIGGAVAAWAWGEPRSTLDIDLVVDIPVELSNLLSEELAKRNMLVPADIILDAILANRADMPLNAIHIISGFKADLYLLRTHDELRRSALERRRQVDFGPPIGTVFVHSPEDLILYKILYFSISGQTKHLRDIAAILKSMGGEIDYPYIETWAERKGLQVIWQQILDKLQK